MEQKTIDRLVREIADELFTVFTGTKHQEMGNRLAVMQGQHGKEKNLGGRNRPSVEEALRRHLSEV